MRQEKVAGEVMKKKMSQILITIFSLASTVQAKTAASSYGAFEKACAKKIEKQADKQDFCGCLIANYRIKNLSDSQLATLTLLYSDKKIPSDEQTNVLFAFDADLAEQCLADPKKRIEGDDDDAAPEPKMSVKSK